MAKDVELDRLKAAQDSAFQRKQKAYKERQRTWEYSQSFRPAHLTVQHGQLKPLSYIL
jgi:hypothetical protein